MPHPFGQIEIEDGPGLGVEEMHVRRVVPGKEGRDGRLGSSRAGASRVRARLIAREKVAEFWVPAFANTSVSSWVVV